MFCVVNATLAFVGTKRVLTLSILIGLDTFWEMLIGYFLVFSLKYCVLGIRIVFERAPTVNYIVVRSLAA